MILIHIIIVGLIVHEFCRKFEKSQDHKKHIFSVGRIEDNFEKVGCENIGLSKLATLDLIHCILCKLGCKPTVNDNEILSAQYNGEIFYIQIEQMQFRIATSLAITKKHEVYAPNIPEIINAINCKSISKTFYSKPINNQLGVMIYSRFFRIIKPYNKVTEIYISHILNCFFSWKGILATDLQLS